MQIHPGDSLRTRDRPPALTEEPVRFLLLMPGCCWRETNELTNGAFCLVGCKFRPNRFLPLPIFLAQIFFQDFPCTGLWQTVKKFNGTGTLVMRQARTAKFDQLTLACLRPGFQNYKCLRHFAPLFVRHTIPCSFDNQGLRHTRLSYFDL